MVKSDYKGRGTDIQSPYKPPGEPPIRSASLGTNTDAQKTFLPMLRPSLYRWSYQFTTDRSSLGLPVLGGQCRLPRRSSSDSARAIVLSMRSSNDSKQGSVVKLNRFFLKKSLLLSFRT